MTWFIRHKILSTIIGVFVLLMAIGTLAPEDDTTEPLTADADPQAQVTVTVTETPEPAPQEDTAAAEAEPSTPTPTKTRSATAEPEPKAKPRRKVRRYAVLDVIDGDTVKVAYQGGESVRVIGIDTPETVHPSVPDECWGEAASNAAAQMLTGKKVSLVFDPTQGRRDTYDRLLAYIHAPGVGDFGLAMLKRGHAAEYTYDTAYRRQSRYIAAENQAQASNKAMWRTCGGPDVPKDKPAPAPAPAPAPDTDSGSAGNCAPGYDPCVPAYPPDVDCADVDGPIRVTGDDPHGLDGEGDGIACES